jgi:hypothetical protein
MVWWQRTVRTEGGNKRPDVTAETTPNTLIGAPQAEVDLEAQPLNFPPMPDMFDIEYTWSHVGLVTKADRPGLKSLASHSS